MFFRYGSGAVHFADDSQMSDIGDRWMLQSRTGTGPMKEERR
jgi:hypothetical protein